MNEDNIGSSAELLEPHAVPNALVELIRASEKWLVLISPYFSPWRHLRDALEDAREENVNIHFLVRADQIEAAMPHFEALDLAPQALERLHAKIFVNEQEALLTSMNLYSASRESIEFGLRIKRSRNAALYNDVVELARSIFRRAEPVDIRRKNAHKEVEGRPVKANVEATKIPRTKDKPLSRTEYLSFQLWKDKQTVTEIAKQRKLKPNTIYSHLSKAIEVGWVDVKEVVDANIRQVIIGAIREVGHEADIRHILGACQDSVSYGEVKCVLAALAAAIRIKEGE